MDAQFVCPIRVELAGRVKANSSQESVQALREHEREHGCACPEGAYFRMEMATTTAQGRNYVIEPDVVIIRYPEKDTVINSEQPIVDDTVARRTSLREINGARPFLHASISCKWTLRNDRAQNARSEALILIRNRKGRLPHTVVVTAEPFPPRLASLALGAGDLDCVYHFALAELMNAVSDNEVADNLVKVMVEGKWLKDISDLPLDLAV